MEPQISPESQNSQNTNKQSTSQPISKEEKDEIPQPPYKTINDFLSNFYNSMIDLILLWGYITDNENFDDPKEIKKTEKELKEEILEQIELAKKMNIEDFQTDEKVIAWMWNKLYKRDCQDSISHLHFNGLQWWLYDNCLVYALAPQIRDFKLLDRIRYDLRNVEFVTPFAIRIICEDHELAIRSRLINKTTNMIEYMNKENDGWYGDPKKAKIKCEICWYEDHAMKWDEDVGVTSFYLDHLDEVEKYAEKHNWSDNKKFHAIKIIKKNVIADENAKGMNTLRFIDKLNKNKFLKPLLREDYDYEMFRYARNEIYGKIKYIDKHELTKEQLRDLEMGRRY